MFYHITRRPMDATLKMLLGKATQGGLRVVVVGPQEDRLKWLDEQLWQGTDDSFLPHGVADGSECDARQPILLSTRVDAPNGATCLMSIDGADVPPETVNDLDRVCMLFDGNDPSSLEVARGQWRRFKEAGVPAEYWSEESGAWEKKAQT